MVTNNEYSLSSIFAINKGGCFIKSGTVSQVPYIWNRSINMVASDTLNFGHCSRYSITNGTSAQDNSSLIPVSVYGIKIG